MSFLEYIGDNYDDLKKYFKILSHKSNIEFDEDVFHTTICNCHKAILKNNISFNNDGEMKAYFLNSYRINSMREKLYFSNKAKDDISDIDAITNSYIDSTLDLYKIQELIICKFGYEMFEIFIEYANGESILKLQDMHSNIRNLKQKIKNIKIFIEKFRDA